MGQTGPDQLMVTGCMCALMTPHCEKQLMHIPMLSCILQLSVLGNAVIAVLVLAR